MTGQIIVNNKLFGMKIKIYERYSYNVIHFIKIPPKSFNIKFKRTKDNAMKFRIWITRQVSNK